MQSRPLRKHGMQHLRKASVGAALALSLAALPALAQNEGPVTTTRAAPPGIEVAPVLPPPPLPPSTAVNPARDYAVFPEATPEAVSDWILKNLDNTLVLTLVTSGPKLTVWILPDRIDRSEAPRILFWERDEVTDAEAEQQVGGRSVMLQKEIDCQRKLARTRYTTIYKGNNLHDYAHGEGGDGSAQLIRPGMYETLEMEKVC